MQEIEHFKCTSDDNRHVAWCGVCAWQKVVDGEGRGSSAKIRRAVLAHMQESGHDIVHIDVTRQHGYRRKGYREE